MPTPDYLRLSPDGIASSSDWWRSGAQRAFGGQLVAHAMLATSRACAANPATQGFGFHSIKISFLTAGQCVDTKYKVEPLRIGRTYAVFQCSGIEVEERSPLVVATISFARAERGPFLHQDPLPAVRLPPPDFLQSARSSEEDAPWPCVVAADDTGRRWYITWAGLGAGDGSGATLQRTSPRICHAAALLHEAPPVCPDFRCARSHSASFCFCPDPLSVDRGSSVVKMAPSRVLSPR